ncbi:penicillin-binding protein activator [Vibrio quintilis]|uniref:Penicillin-binding protein activator LpoA n=1 Tax=Vibrio quintilis TaxID=1117707 RepID=A0A1M7YW66_9VIBR|nr:penicillin-binding protein activator [Vibrio quintilis]SHO56726.1 Penicillin-binding protein activator LpoA precursor [Vibrio quintilis]
MAKKKHTRFNFVRLITSMMLTVFLVACSSRPGVPTRPDISATPTQSSQTYLMRADSTDGQIRNDWLIMALKAAIQEKQVTQANLLLFRLTKETLSEQQLAEWQLARARLLLNNGQYKTALKQLTFKAWWKLKDNQWRSFYQIRAALFTRMGHNFDTARALNNEYDYSSEQQKEKLAHQIWQNLTRYSASEITGLTVESDEDQLAGWLQLAIYMKVLDNNIAQLKNTLEKWLAENKDHPAVKYMPPEVRSVLSMKISTPKQIALLLPVTGKFSQQAQLIRDGFMFSMMNNRERNANITMTVMDTHAQTLEDIAGQIREKHIDFVVGPLVKENITRLRNIEKEQNHQIQMLALNIPENTDKDINICYFALSPEQEAAQAAKHLFRLGYQYPMILAPQGNYGARVSDAFRTEWEKYSNHAVSLSTFGDKKHLQKDINAAFGLKESQQNIAQMQSLLGMKLQSQPRSRRDVDAVYIVANSAELTLIKPFIEVAINPDTTQPRLFSSSRSNSGKNKYEDLSGVTFSDIPLLINPQASVKEQMDSLWPKDSNGEKRLKAMGMDAYTLMLELSQMKAVSDYQVQGQTGLLSIDNRCVVQQELSWGKYDDL